MEIQATSAPQKRSRRFLNLLVLSSAVFAALISIANLAIFSFLNKFPLLLISGGSILCATFFLALRRLVANKPIFFVSLLAEIIWSGLFVLHATLWEEATVSILFGLWVLPLLLAQNTRSWGQRLGMLVLPAGTTFLIVAFLENTALPIQLRTNDLAFMRLITATYVTLFGIFLFSIVLGSFSNRGLYVRILAALAILLLIPISVLSIISYYNSIISNTLAATRVLSQVIDDKNKSINQWGTLQASLLQTPLQESDSFLNILTVLAAHNDALPVPLDESQSVLEELNLVLSQSNFEEIFLLDKRGTVVVSTRDDLIGKDFRYLEAFWQGKAASVILSPRYYPPEDEVSVFISRPIRNYSGEVVGVLSGRATIDAILSIVNQPAYNSYLSTKVYLIGPDGLLLNKSQGKPTQTLQTEAVLNLVATHASGNGAYNNTEGIPVIGVYFWNDELKIGLIAEAEETETYQGLSTIIGANLGIATTAFVLAIIASLTIVRSITNPIATLLKTSQEVIKGNLGARAEVESEDEIGALAKTFNEMTEKLESFVANLEAKVEERTMDLQQRSLELQTAAQIARDASLASNMDDLLSRTARLIHDRFGFYHVGIFLNDANNEYAVLRAAAGDAGQVMLANKHKLLIGETGIVGYVAKWGEPRIALDVGEDAVHFRNPLLPYTRSEMALPLRIGATVLGVLDVQSEKANAFNQNDITIMSILTDQLSIAIERTRLLQESQENARALEELLQGQTARAWREYLDRLNKPRGYRYEGSRIEPLDALYVEELKRQTSAKPTILPDATRKQGSIALIPIRLRGYTLGGLQVRLNSQSVNPETLKLLEEAANRLALALENARLIRDAQRAAAQEQQLNIISAQIQQSTDLEIILQTTVQELGRTLGVPTAFIQVGLMPADPESAENSE